MRCSSCSRDRFGFQPIELRDERVGGLLRRVARLHDGDGVEQIRILDEVGLSERRDRDLLLVDQLLVDARALSVRQHLGGDVQRIRVRMAVRRHVVRDDHGRQRPRLLQRHPLLLRLRRLARDVARHLVLGLRHAAEILSRRAPAPAPCRSRRRSPASHSTARSTCDENRARRPPRPPRDPPCCRSSSACTDARVNAWS